MYINYEKAVEWNEDRTQETPNAIIVASYDHNKSQTNQNRTTMKIREIFVNQEVSLI